MLRDNAFQPSHEMTLNHSLLSTKALLQVENPDGRFKTVKGSASNAINVSLDDGIGQSAFGELSVVNMTPVVQELFTYNINSRIWDTTVANTGTITVSNFMSNVASGTTASSTANLQSQHRVKYRPGEGVMGRFTGIFTAGVAGTTQLIGIGDADNGFFFGYNGTTFGIMHRNSASGTKVETWTAQASWNGDIASGTDVLPLLDQTKGNVYQIKFQYLGFGVIYFYIENPADGKFILVHTIRYSNTSTVPSLSNSSLPFNTYVSNGSTTSNIVIKSASVLLGVEGQEKRLGLKNAYTRELTGIGDTSTAVFTLRNMTTYNSLTNTSKVFLTMLNIAAIQNASARAAVVSLVLNATLGGSPSYTDIDTNESIIEYDTSGTTVSGGETLISLVVRANESVNVKLHDMDIHIHPEDTLTLAASTATGTVDIFGSLLWLEDI